MRQHKYLLITFFSILSFLSSCDKGDDFIDSNAAFPIGWKSSDSFDLIAFNSKDTLGSIIKQSVAPIGMISDANFGTTRASVYSSYQTTTDSKLFNFTSIDSVVLILPYYLPSGIYGQSNKSYSVEVHEMTEAIETSFSSKKINYSYNPTVIGSATNFKPNLSDSVMDGSNKIAPSLRIKLDNSFGQKIINPGSYVDDAAFQSVMKGLYIRATGSASSDGMFYISTFTDNKIVIYGKNASNLPISSSFITGSSASTSTNEYLHDNNSKAGIAASGANKVTGDNILYGSGLYGYISKLKLPNIKNIGANKNIFRAELSLYSIDTGYYQTTYPGLMYIDSLKKVELAIPDEYYKQIYYLGKKDTMINGTKCTEYKYNISLLVNSILSNQAYISEINIYPYHLNVQRSNTYRLSNAYPAQLILGGTGHAAKPKLKLFFTEK